MHAQVIISPWHDFFAFLEGHNHRLSHAVNSLLAQRRNGELVACLSSVAGFDSPLQRLLDAFGDSLRFMSDRDGQGMSEVIHSVNAELYQAAEAYYRTQRASTFDDQLLTNLKRVARLLKNEHQGPLPPRLGNLVP